MSTSKPRGFAGARSPESPGSPSKLGSLSPENHAAAFRSRARREEGTPADPSAEKKREGEFSASDAKPSVSLLRSLTVATPKRNRRWRLGGRLGRIMRVEYAGGATWEEAMPPLAPSDRSPTATPELNCSATYPEVPSPTPKSGFLAVRR